MEAPSSSTNNWYGATICDTEPGAILQPLILELEAAEKTIYSSHNRVPARSATFNLGVQIEFKRLA